MANELRVRANLLPTLVLTSAYDPSSDTTIAAAELASWPVIDATNHMAVMVDWDRATGTPFILYITAHSSGATTATVAKDQEGTTATSVPIGTECIHGPTVQDYILSIDSPHGGDLGYDVAFNRQGETTLPTGWSWDHQGTATYLEQDGAGVISVAAGGDPAYIGRGIPSEASFVADFKYIPAIAQRNYSGNGVWVGETGYGKKVLLYQAETGQLYLTNFDGGSLIGQRTITINTVRFDIRYWRIGKNSATDWDFWVSPDGLSWVPCQLASDVSDYVTTPVEIGVKVGGANSQTYPHQSSLYRFTVR